MKFIKLTFAKWTHQLNDKGEMLPPENRSVYWNTHLFKFFHKYGSGTQITMRDGKKYLFKENEDDIIKLMEGTK